MKRDNHEGTWPVSEFEISSHSAVRFCFVYSLVLHQFCSCCTHTPVACCLVPFHYAGIWFMKDFSCVDTGSYISTERSSGKTGEVCLHHGHVVVAEQEVTRTQYLSLCAFVYPV